MSLSRVLNNMFSKKEISQLEEVVNKKIDPIHEEYRNIKKTENRNLIAYLITAVGLLATFYFGVKADINNHSSRIDYPYQQSVEIMKEIKDLRIEYNKKN